MAREEPRRGRDLDRTGELPPYYGDSLSALPVSGKVSVRRRGHAGAGADEAEGLFRDFKLGLLTLVIIALLLLAYFWDGGSVRSRKGRGDGEVLSIRLSGKRRAEVRPTGRAPSVAGALLGGPVDAGARPASGSAATSPRRAAPERGGPATRRREAPRRSFVYTVKRGETLSYLALRFYGDAAGWELIMRANGARLRRPTDLRAGMKIIIPAKIAG